MPKYLFTSDLRISQLSDKIQYFAKFFNEGGDITDIQDKSENNNANTLKFYFNLHKDTEICQLAEKSPKDAIRNFITKFQFPNPRTKESLKDSLDEGILLAPYRTIIQILNALDSPNNITSISYQEILYWVFCHRGVTQDPFYDIKTLVSKIKFDRNADYERLIKESLTWKQYERQSRELIKILTYSSNCFYTKDNKLFFNRNHPDYLSDKSFIDEVASYNKFWIPSENGSYEQITNEYISYMDTRDTAYNIVKISRNKISHELVETTSISNSFRPYFTAIRTKPFLLLAGISGTGKSRIVKDMAFQTCPNVGDLRSDNVSPGNYCLVEVKPNWHDSTELLGYDSVISEGYIVTKFVKFLVKAMLNDDIPFFVCLDEMNLAPVEQ